MVAQTTHQASRRRRSFRLRPIGYVRTSYFHPEETPTQAPLNPHEQGLVVDPRYAPVLKGVASNPAGAPSSQASYRLQQGSDLGGIFRPRHPEIPGRPARAHRRTPPSNPRWVRGSLSASRPSGCPGQVGGRPKALRARFSSSHCRTRQACSGKYAGDLADQAERGRLRRGRARTTHGYCAGPYRSRRTGPDVPSAQPGPPAAGRMTLPQGVIDRVTCIPLRRSARGLCRASPCGRRCEGRCRGGRPTPG